MNQTPLRVLQLIDSLDPGGSEKMAVQIANELNKTIELSALACTRKSGALKNELSTRVISITANKKGKFDLKAFFKLKAFIKSNRINIIHAHSTSFFWGTILKMLSKDVKLIWHDHYGYRTKTSKRSNLSLYFFSIGFDHIITVNEGLKQWANTNLNCTSVNYLPNFKSNISIKSSSPILNLKGKFKAIKIVHVANLRPEKDHMTALRAINILIKKNLDISYHLIGKYDSNSDYYNEIKQYIRDKSLSESVFIYGCQSNIPSILKQADIGLLSSTSEGLPVSLIEYVIAELPLIVTNVGECKQLVGNHGNVIDVKNENQLSNAILDIIENWDIAKLKSSKLKEVISRNFNSTKVIAELINIYHISLQNLPKNNN
jgi:glycosyltransferase involved in cell wall biosynthesis